MFKAQASRVVSLLFFVALSFRPLYAQFEFFAAGEYSPKINSPAQFFGYAPGERFTPHHRILDYLTYLTEVSERVKIAPYGETYEHRPLVYLTISSPANLARLGEIQKDLAKLRISGDNAVIESICANAPVIAWLSYGVHGNESSSSEAAMQVAYQLVAGTDSLTLALLTRLVVIVDPVLNPDGRERYVSWYQTAVGKKPNADPATIEHSEPWPGGRTNHYYFDLNRDWAWLTQQESRDRIALYKKWYPQLHVDFHEMSYEETYFFFPPQGPILRNLPQETLKWMQKYGEQNAAAFDKFGWGYYSREDFDVFYPGYGDSWPSLNGAIGMTYEQAGSGAAGTLVERTDGTRLSLRDRIHHHFTTSMATLATTAKYHNGLLRDFRKFWVSATKEAAQSAFSGYLLVPGQSRTRYSEFKQKLDALGIVSQQLSQSREFINARELLTDKKTTIKAAAGDLYLPIKQEQTRLLQVLFEPNPALTDTFFYDITAWCYPVAYGIQAYKIQAKERTLAATETVPTPQSISGKRTPPSYAYLFSWGDIPAAGLVFDLLENGVRCYVAKKEFKLSNRGYQRGDVVVPIFPNKTISNLHVLVDSLARKWQIDWDGTDTGLSKSGVDLGSSNVVWLRTPKIAVVTDEPISPTAYGTIWFLLDQLTDAPFSGIRADKLRDIDFDKYNVFVLPDGFRSYTNLLDSARVADLKSWVADGGVLIGIGAGARFLCDKKNHLSKTAVKKENAGKDSSYAQNKADEKRKLASLLWDEKQQRNTRERIPGTIFRLRIDNTHPLGYGQDAEVFMLKQNKPVFELSDAVHNVGIFPAGAYVSGYINVENAKFVENTAAITVEKVGKGVIILFADDPNFRMFWRATTGLFLNAILLGNLM